PTATQTPTPSPTTTTPPPPGSVGVSQADFFFTPSTVRVGTGQKVTVANISADSRSEEHTSELQSLTNLVCRLLLEKKKNDDLRGPTPELGRAQGVATGDTIRRHSEAGGGLLPDAERHGARVADARRTPTLVDLTAA